VRTCATPGRCEADARHYLGTKRQILDNGYYETFNRDKRHLGRPARRPDSGDHTRRGAHRDGRPPLDMLVLATGFDAISGTLLRLNPKGAAASA